MKLLCAITTFKPNFYYTVYDMILVYIYTDMKLYTHIYIYIYTHLKTIVITYINIWVQIIFDIRVTYFLSHIYIYKWVLFFIFEYKCEFTISCLFLFYWAFIIIYIDSCPLRNINSLSTKIENFLDSTHGAKLENNWNLIKFSLSLSLSLSLYIYIYIYIY